MPTTAIALAGYHSDARLAALDVADEEKLGNLGGNDQSQHRQNPSQTHVAEACPAESQSARPKSCSSKVKYLMPSIKHARKQRITR